jgi:hypothetical protein
MPGTSARIAGLVPVILRGHKPHSGVSPPSREGGTRANSGVTRAGRRARRAWTHVAACVLPSLSSVDDERASIVRRWAGAICLAYLGFKQWRSGAFATSPVLSEGAGQRGLFWRGFATSGPNPQDAIVLSVFLSAIHQYFFA